MMTAAHEKPEWAQSKREKENASRAAQGLKPRRRIWPWIVLAVVALAIAAFVFLSPPSPPAIETPVDETAVSKFILPSETLSIAPATLRQTAKVTGTLVPGQQASVASQASGRVMEVLVRPGDTVRQGDLLAEIDRAPLELQLNQQNATADATRAQLLSSRLQLDRTEELAAKGLATSAVLEQARSATAALEANLAALESAVQAAQLALDNTHVTSPLSGVVASRSVDPGQTVSAGTPLFDIVNLDQMVFEAAASINSSAMVEPGQAVLVFVTGLDGEQFTGAVTRVNPVATPGTRTLTIYIELPNTGNRLRGGMFATGDITVAEKTDAVAVPAIAIGEDAQGHYVLKLVDGTLERQEVEPGQPWDRGRLVEVTGLEAGDVILAAQLSNIAAGDTYTLAED